MSQENLNHAMMSMHVLEIMCQIQMTQVYPYVNGLLFLEDPEDCLSKMPSSL